MSDPAVTAVILAGGRARRLGGAAKPLLTVGESSLLDLALDAASIAGSLEPIVVGPPVTARTNVRIVREDPPFGGPVAAIAAALPHVSTDWILVLAADLPRAPRIARILMDELTGVTRTGGARMGDARAGDARADNLDANRDGLCLQSDDGRTQWLSAIYRTDALRAAVARLGSADGASMRDLVGALTLQAVTVAATLTHDVDTWEDLVVARQRVARQRAARGITPDEIAPEEDRPMADSTSRTLPPEALEDWAAALRAELGLSDNALPISLVLDLARDVAVAVARPAAPLSAFAAGLAAGRAGGDPEAIRAAVASVTELASMWSDPDETDS